MRVIPLYSMNPHYLLSVQYEASVSVNHLIYFDCMSNKILDAAKTHVDCLDQLKSNSQIVDYRVMAMRLSLDESGSVVGTVDVSTQPVATVDRITLNTTVSRYEAASVELADQKYYTSTTFGNLSRVLNYDTMTGAILGVADVSGN